MTKNQKVKKSDANIKILVACHKPSAIPVSSMFLPIQVGAALSDTDLGFTRDDSGIDTISQKNRSYCELTALYWAWKNLKADYYGLFHYRRYLSFSSGNVDDEHAITYEDLSFAESQAHFDTERIRRITEQYDVIVPRKNSIKSFSNYKSIYEQYKGDHYIQDLDYCLDYIRRNYPDIAPSISSLYADEGYFCNMFIMKKDIFMDYCEYMFDVIDNFSNNNDISDYNPYQYRVCGFIAERLTNIYIHYLFSKNKYKIKELKTVFIKNTEPQKKLKPVSDKNNVAVVLAANNYYVPYISSLLHSVADVSTKTYTYDINIFHRDISAENAKLLRSEFAHMDNLSIRFYDISPRYEQYKNLFTRGHFAIETYFRLFIQDIMIDYDKVLYLDGDMIVRSDIAKLYEINVNHYLLAAALDPDTAGLYNGFELQKKHYMDSILKIKKPYEYFQAGVILFNLDNMRKTLNVDELLKFAGSYNWELLDQDVLNYFAQGKTKFIDMSWNVMYDWQRIRLAKIVSLAPIHLYLKYVEARKNPKIIHYAGPEKPWHDPECDYASLYWEAARKSVFYEVIIARMGDWRQKRTDQDARKLPFKRRTINKTRRLVDVIAPNGTHRRKSITKLSREVKHALRQVKK